LGRETHRKEARRAESGVRFFAEGGEGSEPLPIS